MEATLVNFIRALRLAGAPVSTTEAIDAVRALAVIGYDDRATMKTALGAVLAKSVDEKLRHDQLFDLYFAANDAQASPPQDDETPPPAADDAAAADRFMEMAGAPQSGAAALAISGAANAVGADQIRFATQTGHYTRKILERLGVRALEQRLIERLSEHTPEGDAAAEQMSAARAAMQRAARAEVDRRFALYGRAATDAFLDEIVKDRAIGALTRADLDRLRRVVTQMAKRLAVKYARRRKSHRKERLDLRRTLAASAAHDGAPFDLYWKSKRKDRPKIVAICDVSGSVARYVRFLLMLLFLLQETVADIETFAFSGRLEDVAPILKARTFDAAMDEIILRVGSGSTDYGQAFVDLFNERADKIDKRTTVLILGDGRSNQSDPRLDLFAQLADRAKRVVWLSPEPEGSWGLGDSCLLQYRPYCSTLRHCATVSDLEDALDELLLAYA